MYHTGNTDTVGFFFWSIFVSFIIFGEHGGYGGVVGGVVTYVDVTF